MSADVPRFVVPIRGVNTFCTVAGGELVPVNPLPVVEGIDAAVCPVTGWVAWVTDDGRAVGRTHLDAGPDEQTFPPVPLPAGYKAATLAMRDGVLFVGGDCGTEVAGFFDLARPDPTWVPLEIPQQFRRHGKKIDEFLFDDDRLIAVDDTIFPKYLLLYDAADTRRPTLVGVRDLVIHGTDEWIRAGTVGGRWVALLSSTSGRGGSYWHISFLDRLTLGEYGHMAVPMDYRFKRKDKGEPTDEFRMWAHLTLAEETVVVAAGMDGLALLDLTSVARPSRTIPLDEERGWPQREAEHERFCDACEQALCYLDLPQAAGPVVRVRPVPGSRAVLAVFDTGTGFDTVPVPVP